MVTSFRRTGWDRAIGSSGTVRAALSVIRGIGAGESRITSEALEAVIARMIAASSVDRLDLPGLSVDRRPVFAGGIVILIEILGSFGIDSMAVSDGALREGLLYDILGRMHHHDARERSIRAMQAKFHTDEEQAQRVDATAALLLDEVAHDWELSDERHRQLLHWAARLHEVGLDIAHAKYHHHGAYLLANADMPGFTHTEQRLLALIVGNHRRRFDASMLDSVPDDWRVPVFRLTVLLRLAVLLHRARSSESLPALKVKAGPARLTLRIDRGWFAANPLTHADLQHEQEYLRAVDFELDVGTAKLVRKTLQAR